MLDYLLSIGILSICEHCWSMGYFHVCVPSFNTHCLTQIFTFSGGVECLRETGRERYVKHMMLLNAWLENKKTTSINDSLYNDGDSSNCHGTQKNSSYGQIQGPEELRIGTHTKLKQICWE